ncbi:MAG: hypothetical protein QXK24_02270 [Ignisphaera sp.]
MNHENRIRKYEKTTNIGVGKLSELKNLMDTQFVKETTKLKDVDRKVSEILNKHGIPANMRIGYINFARSLFRAYKSQSSQAISTIAISEFNKYHTMGLNQLILREISSLFGIAPSGGAGGEFYHEFRTLGNWDLYFTDPPDIPISFINGWIDIPYGFIAFLKYMDVSEIEANIYVPIPEPQEVNYTIYTSIVIVLFRGEFPNQETVCMSAVIGAYNPYYIGRYSIVSISTAYSEKQDYRIINPDEWNPYGIVKVKLDSSKARIEFNDITAEVNETLTTANGFAIVISHIGDFPIEQRAKINYIRAKP